jgi:hypothetical protein
MRLEHIDTISPGFSGHQTCVKYRGCCPVELNCKGLREIFDAKRADIGTVVVHFLVSLHRCPAMYDYILRPTFSATHSTPSEYSQEEYDKVCQPGRQFTETYKIM